MRFSSREHAKGTSSGGREQEHWQVYAVSMSPHPSYGCQFATRARMFLLHTPEKPPGHIQPYQAQQREGAASMRFSCPAWINGTAIHAGRVILMMNPNVRLIPAMRYPQAECRQSRIAVASSSGTTMPRSNACVTSVDMPANSSGKRPASVYGMMRPNHSTMSAALM